MQAFVTNSAKVCLIDKIRAKWSGKGLSWYFKAGLDMTLIQFIRAPSHQWVQSASIVSCHVILKMRYYQLLVLILRITSSIQYRALHEKFRDHYEAEKHKTDEKSVPFERVTQLYSKASKAHVQIIGRRVDALGEDGSPYGKNKHVYFRTSILVLTSTLIPLVQINLSVSKSRRFSPFGKEFSRFVCQAKRNFWVHAFCGYICIICYSRCIPSFNKVTPIALHPFFYFHSVIRFSTPKYGLVERLLSLFQM